MDNVLFGKHQFDFLVSKGLRPESTLLDIGCGPPYEIRLARHAVEYLDEGNYIGIDRLPLTDFQQRWASEHPKKPLFVLDDDFNFPDRMIDMAWSQSVFTHISLEKIKRCLLKLRPLLVGSYYTTFNLYRENRLGELKEGETDVYVSTRYALSAMKRVAEQTGYQLEYIGDWDDLHKQKMLRFF